MISFRLKFFLQNIQVLSWSIFIYSLRLFLVIQYKTFKIIVIKNYEYETDK